MENKILSFHSKDEQIRDMISQHEAKKDADLKMLDLKINNGVSPTWDEWMQAIDTISEGEEIRTEIKKRWT